MSDYPIIGTGTHRYRMRRDWAQLPGGRRFGTTHGVVEDSAGRIFIHHTGAECTFIFSPEGDFLHAWGGDYAEGAHGMHLNRAPDGEFLYLAATSTHVVLKTTLEGEEVLRLGAPDRPDIYASAEEFVPTEAAVAANGDIYVADGYGKPWIHRFSASGEYINSFGGEGLAPGRLRNPHGIMIDTRGPQELVLVSDRGNSRFQYFTLEGVLVRELLGEFRQPCTTVQWGEELYVPDLHARLTVLDKDDRLLAHLGDWPGAWKEHGWPNLPEKLWRPDKFSSPHDLHVDGAGNIYVVEWLSEGTGNVSKLERLSA